MDGQQIRQLRESAGLQGKFVAEAAGLTKQQLWHIESGKREIKVNEFVALLAAMGYRAGDFLPNSLGEDVVPVLPIIAVVQTIDPAHLPWLRSMLEGLARELAAPRDMGNADVLSRQVRGPIRSVTELWRNDHSGKKVGG